MLVIAFGTSKFHKYIYGKKVTVESDHKPLEILFKKPLSMAPQRIQRVMQYDLIVKYRPSDQLYIADFLSRASQWEWQADEFEVHLLVQISKKRLMSLRERERQWSSVIEIEGSDFNRLVREQARGGAWITRLLSSQGVLATSSSSWSTLAGVSCRYICPCSREICCACGLLLKALWNWHSAKTVH